MLTVSHGTVNYSTQIISIQTPYGVKVTPEQKPGTCSEGDRVRKASRHAD